MKEPLGTWESFIKAVNIAVAFGDASVVSVRRLVASREAAESDWEKLTPAQRKHVVIEWTDSHVFSDHPYYSKVSEAQK